MSDGAADGAAEVGERAHDSDALDVAIRVGLVVYGVVHLLVGWLGLQLALGNGGRRASTSGALHELVEQPFGAVLLWLVAGGLAALVVWRLLELFHGHEGEDGLELWRKRATSLLKACLYGALATSAVKVAVGNGSRGGTDSTTKKLMDLPGGQVVVGLVALAILGYGAGMVVRAWTEGFRKHLDSEGERGHSGTAYVWFGKLGYSAKGVALGAVGVLFGYAAWTHDPKKSGGLDVALAQLKQQPYGPWLLGAVAVGIGCYGLFCFARARHLSR